MSLWVVVADIVGAAVLLVLLYGLSLIVRRRWIARDGGTFELSLRARSPKAGRGWVLGVGRYTGDVLEFFRVFSVYPGPMRTLRRAGLTYVGTRPPVGGEAHALYAGHVIIECQTSEGPVEMALAPEALTGFLAWVEAGPPGAGQTIV